MNTPSLPTDELFQLEHRIAQRADELARESNLEEGYALTHWQRAEAEVWSDESGWESDLVYCG